MKNCIDEEKILGLLDETKSPSLSRVKEIIEKSLNLEGLSPVDVAMLLNCDDEIILQKLFSAAKQIKDAIYGNRLVLFAPLYLSNRCINECLYCGFRRNTEKSKKQLLTINEVRDEVKALIAQGHKRLLLVSAEDPAVDIDYLRKIIRVVYETKNGPGDIKRVNVNVAPMNVENFARLKDAGIGTYQIFQETYHRETYKELHPLGPKSDYLNRLYACDYAQKGGVDDVGIGVLFGLYNYKYEVLALLYHALCLESTYGAGPHTISVPRIEPAQGSHAAAYPPCRVTDKELKKIVSILRLAIPYTGIILSTRENAALRRELIHLGVSQISAGSKTVPGSYSVYGNDKMQGQFDISDNRSLSEVIEDLVFMGYFPSFCTSCYRTGRTGESFMNLAKPGEIKNWCQPNALFTFHEYLSDYNPELAKKLGTFLASEIHKIDDVKMREMALSKMESLVQGERDIYF